MHSGAKSQAHFTDGTGVHFPAPRSFYSLAAVVIERRVSLSLVVELNWGSEQTHEREGVHYSKVFRLFPKPRIILSR